MLFRAIAMRNKRDPKDDFLQIFQSRSFNFHSHYARTLQWRHTTSNHMTKEHLNISIMAFGEIKLSCSIYFHNIWLQHCTHTCAGHFTAEGGNALGFLSCPHPLGMKQPKGRTMNKIPQWKHDAKLMASNKLNHLFSWMKISTVLEYPRVFQFMPLV
jgi:hypothetical protein